MGPYEDPPWYPIPWGHGIRYGPPSRSNPEILQNRAKLPRSESPHGIGFGPKNQIRYRGGLGSRTVWQIQGSIRYDPICRCIKYPGSGTISDQEGLGMCLVVFAPRLGTAFALLAPRQCRRNRVVFISQLSRPSVRASGIA